MSLFLILFLLLFGLISYKKPAWGLGLVLFLLPAYLWRFNLTVPTTLLELMILLFIAITASKLKTENFVQLRQLGKINYAIGLFLAAGMIAALAAPEMRPALGQLKAFIMEPVLLFYASVLVLDSEKKKQLALKLLFLSASLIAGLGIVQYFTFLGLPLEFWGTSGGEMRRITSVFEYPNALALYLAPLFALFVVLWLKNYRLWQNHAWEALGLVVMLAALILTFSRGAWLALILLGLILLTRQLPWKKTLAAFAIVIVAIAAIAPIRNRLASSFTDQSSRDRGQILQIAASAILSQPFLGNGLGGFDQTLEQAEFTGRLVNYPHNVFLNFWLEMGLLGLIAFALIVVFTLEHYQRHRNAIAWAAGLALIVILLHGQVDVPYFKNDLSVVFWFLISLFYPGK